MMDQGKLKLLEVPVTAVLINMTLYSFWHLVLSYLCGECFSEPISREDQKQIPGRDRKDTTLPQGTGNSLDLSQNLVCMDLDHLHILQNMIRIQYTDDNILNGSGEQEM